MDEDLPLSSTAAFAFSRPWRQNCPPPGLSCTCCLPNSARKAENKRDLPSPPKRPAKVTTGADSERPCFKDIRILLHRSGTSTRFMDKLSRTWCSQRPPQAQGARSASFITCTRLLVAPSKKESTFSHIH